jgi:hypothetical protein
MRGIRLKPSSLFPTFLGTWFLGSLPFLDSGYVHARPYDWPPMSMSINFPVHVSAWVGFKHIPQPRKSYIEILKSWMTFENSIFKSHPRISIRSGFPDFGPDPDFFEQTSPDLVWFEPLKSGLTIFRAKITFWSEQRCADGV